MKNQHFINLENMYRNAPTNLYYAPEIKIGKGFAEVCISIKTDFFHTGGAIHGSVYFKALDDSAYFAANSLETSYMLLTTSYTINFLRPVSSGSIKAIGEVVQVGKTVFFAESTLYNEKGKICAKGSGSFVKSGIKLSKDVGYGLENL
jgi:uncharacterized protein (TIGR00369 family)